jgi:hypothetical protein
MGVLYEHWDPIINECFYVGASWTDEDSRPYDFSPRNKLGNYDKRVEQIRSLGKEPEVRLIECSHLTDEELDELEILQIAYWKDLIGERLTNVAKGGRMGWGFAWSEEMCARQSIIMTEYYQTEKGQESIRNGSKTKQDFFNSEEGKDFIAELREHLILFYQTEEGRKSALRNRASQLAMLTTPEGQERLERQKQSLREYLESPQGVAQREKDSREKIEFYSSEEGKIARDNLSKKKIEFYASDEGAKFREQMSETRKEFLESEAGEQYRQNMRQIRLDYLASPEGQEFLAQHSENHSVAMQKLHASDRGVAVREKTSNSNKAYRASPEGIAESERHGKFVEGLWKTPEYRFRMLFRDWHNSNVRTRHYWGA